jgi:hypothetical protein
MDIDSVLSILQLKWFLRSQEAEGINRSLKDLCTRHGIPVPTELDITHTRRTPTASAPHSNPGSPPPLGESIPHLPGSPTPPSWTPSNFLVDSYLPEGPRRVIANGASTSLAPGSPISPASPTTSVLQMVRQLQRVFPGSEAADSGNQQVQPNFDMRERAESSVKLLLTGVSR